VYVYLWFDVEDYVTPESDVALGRLVDMFDRHGLKATFKMVAEKVRGLERRGHHDILASLRAHDVGYHTDYHSKPPSIPEYELELGWEAGIAEFVQREQAGLDTLKRAFGRTPSCYGQPGGSWAPQVYPALRRWGIPVYLDAGPWLALDGRPHRYCDVLDMLGLEGLMHIGIGGGRERVSRCQVQLGRLVERMRPTGGVISLYAHECEFVTQSFWDAVNYAGGADTPRERWQPAPLVSESERKDRYAAMDEFLSFVRSLPDVEVTVASQASLLYLDRAKGRKFTPRQVALACAAMADAITHQQCDEVWLSPAEIYGLAVGLLAARVRNDAWPDHVSYRYLDGPPTPPFAPPASSAVQSSSDHVPRLASSVSRLALDDLFGTCLYEDASLNVNGHMPAQVQVGRNWFSPADFLSTVGAALPRWLDGGTDAAPLVRGDFVQARYVPDHVSWDWLVFPPGFNADPLLQMGKLQAWTLKPATLS
jgi:hypothetical protein